MKCLLAYHHLHTNIYINNVISKMIIFLQVKKQDEAFSDQQTENQRLEEEVENLTAELEKREKQIAALEKEVKSSFTGSWFCD